MAVGFHREQDKTVVKEIMPAHYESFWLYAGKFENFWHTVFYKMKDNRFYPGISVINLVMTKKYASEEGRFTFHVR